MRAATLPFLRSTAALALAVALPWTTRAAAEDANACAPGEAIQVADGLGGPVDDLVRVGELTGAVAPSSEGNRRGAPRTVRLCAAGPALPWALAPAPEGEGWIAPVAPRLTTTFNSRYPSGGNDGLLWAGRGVSSMLTGGVAFRRGILSGAILPEVAWQQNAWFPIVDNGRTGNQAYMNPWYGTAIDLPQRYGAGPFSTASLGQSVLRLDWKGVALGASNENLWWGPGIRNAIVLSDNAPGFPHLFLGTSHPVNIGIGKLDTTATWGRLERTRYFEDGGHPLFVGIVLTYQPRWIPNLWFGVDRAFLQPWDGLRAIDYVPIVQSFFKKDLDGGIWYGDEKTNNLDNQLASLWWRWAFPSAQLEIYGEWAREDHQWSMYRLVQEPDHSQALLLGLQKVFVTRPDRWVRLHVETVRLQEKRPLGNAEGVPVYYTHGDDLGYTHDGQVLGDWIGPGGDSQLLALDVFGRRGRIGGYLERVRRNDAYYWSTIEPQRIDTNGHDTEVTAAVRQVLFAGPVDVSWELGLSYRWNVDFKGDAANVRGMVTIAAPLGRRPAAGAAARAQVPSMANERKDPGATPTPENEQKIGPSGGPPDDRARQWRGSTPSEDVLEQWIERGEPKSTPAENPKDEDAGRS